LLAAHATVVLTVMEVRLMSKESRLEALEGSGLVHPRPGEVTAELFCSGNGFFLAADKVQVKYEMLRAVARRRYPNDPVGSEATDRDPGRCHHPCR